MDSVGGAYILTVRCADQSLYSSATPFVLTIHKISPPSEYLDELIVYEYIGSSLSSGAELVTVTVSAFPFILV